MAQVVRNPDNTITVTFTARELNLIQRWAAEHARTPAAQLEDVINGFLQNKLNDYRNMDGPTKQVLYEALTPAKQAEVDAILNGG